MTLDDSELRKLAAADLAAHPNLPRPVSADPLIELLSDRSPPDASAASDADAEPPAAADGPTILPPLPAAPPLDSASPGSATPPVIPLPLLPGFTPDLAFNSGTQLPPFDTRPPDLTPGDAFEHPVARPGPAVLPFINIGGPADGMPGGPVPPGDAPGPASPRLPPFPLLMHIDPPTEPGESPADASSTVPGLSGHAPPRVRLEWDRGSSSGGTPGGGPPATASGAAGPSSPAFPSAPAVSIRFADDARLKQQTLRAVASDLNKRVEQALQDLRRRMDHYQAQRSAMYRDR